MKRRIFLFVLISIVLCCATLSRDAVCPDRFTGTWYAVGNGEAYCFREGLIFSAQDSFAGAYAFTRDTVTLFMTEPDGESEIRTLRWARQRGEDILRTDQNAILFCRSKESVIPT